MEGYLYPPPLVTILIKKEEMTKNIVIIYIRILGKLAKKSVLFINEKKKLRIALSYKNIIENIKEYIEYIIFILKNLKRRNLKNGLKKQEN